MWEHRQPDVPAFYALVKPMRNIVTGLISVNSPFTSVLNISVIFLPILPVSLFFMYANRLCFKHLLSLSLIFSTAKRNSPVNNQCSPHDTSNPCPAVSIQTVICSRTAPCGSFSPGLN